MIDHGILRYMIWSILIFAAGLAGSLSDTRRRFSRIIRILVYTSPWIMVCISVIAGQALFKFDKTQLIFLFLCSIASISISLYSEGYFRILFGKTSPLQSVIDLGLVLLLLLFMSRNLLELTVFWISVELISFLLILLEKGSENWGVGLKYLTVCATASDISLFSWIAISALKLGLGKALLTDFAELNKLSIEAGFFLTILLLIGFLTKLAQVPLHFWLVDTYTESPSPVTAMFSGIMSKTAIYVLLRLYDTVLLNIPAYTGMTMILGFITTLYGFMMASAQTDIKKMMSYSSMGHYGVMVMLLGLLPYNSIVRTVLYIYALFHGIVKTHIFINTATIEILTNIRDVHRLGYLSRIARKIYEEIVYGIMSLIGVPPSLGFLAKLIVIYVALSMILSGYPFTFLFLIGVTIASIFSVVYSIKYLGAYVGRYTRTPVRPGISVSSLQYYSELMLAYVSIVLPIAIMILKPLDILYPTIFTIYCIATVSMILAKFVYNRLLIYETGVWLGGVEA